MDRNVMFWSERQRVMGIVYDQKPCRTLNKITRLKIKKSPKCGIICQFKEKTSNVKKDKKYSIEFSLKA